MTPQLTFDCNRDAQAAFGAATLFSFVAFEQVSLSEANGMLTAWGHKMGALNRGNQGALCHALVHEGKPVAVTTASRPRRTGSRS